MIDDTSTVSLLHMNGEDASTVFTDESEKVWTANGNAQIDIAQYKFGGASGLFDGTGDLIDTPDHADFDVSSGNFTIDCWIRRNTIGGFQEICGQCDSALTLTTISWLFRIDNTNHLVGGIYSGSTGYIAASAGTIINDGNWHHVAMVRSGNTITLYIDGVADGTISVVGVTANNSANKVSIGRLGEYSANYWNGWVDEFRFSKVARWTSNFTPPTKEYAPYRINRPAMVIGL